MLNLNTPVQYLKGVGPKMSQKLSKLGISHVIDLVNYFPRDYIDFSNTANIDNLRIGDTVVIQAKILSISNHRSPKKRIIITKVRAGELKEPHSEISIIWFNQPFLIDILKPNSVWNFHGKINFDFNLRKKVLLSPIFEKKSAILPVYSLTEGITNKYLKKLITPLLSDSSLFSDDFLPKPIINYQKLIGLDMAIREIHFPISREKLVQARDRLAFNELFLIIIRLLLIKKDISKKTAPKIKINKKLLINFVKSLPYKLTNAQRKASWEIINDLAKSIPMNRLLEGDVGSGKTVVALMSALNSIKSGHQVLWMAPTEILANQHYETTCELLKNFDVKIGLITSKKFQISSQPKKLPTSLKLRGASKSLSQNSELVIGTHALIQKDCKYKNIGLVIIDEQHRFGVKQRAKLAQPNNFNKRSDSTISTSLIPHFLSMTATPIPRTLALSIYSDLDISILDEMPKDRKRIITKLVDPVNREKAYQFIRKQVENGRQIFIICPLIEENSDKRLAISDKLFDLDRKSVKAEYEKLSKQIFPDLKIAMLHGKLKSSVKEKVMKNFSEGKSDILVSTSVVEVGIDIPNATIMMIEDSERFGLAQLHQFRGRVGRGKHQSYCLLFTNSLSVQIKNRLSKLVECSDGFQLAQEDLKLRGPGELVGKAQSGLPDLKIAKLTDIILVNKARKSAEEIIAQGIEKYPKLMEKLSEFETEKHLE